MRSFSRRAEWVGTLTSPLFSFGVLRRKRRNCLDWLFVSAANGKILLRAGKAIDGEEVDAEAFDDLFFINFAEEFFTDQPRGGPIAERALVHFHKSSLVGGKRKEPALLRECRLRFCICLREEAE